MIISGCQDLRTRSASLYVLSDGRTHYHPRGIIAKKKKKKKKPPETDEAFTFSYQYTDNSGDGRTC